MRRVAVLLGPALTLGCRNLPIDTSAPVAEVAVVPPGDALDARATSAIGVVPAAAWVRAVDADGAAIAAGSVDVELAGAPVTVTLDGYGYGELVLDAPGSAAIGGVLEPASLHAVAPDWPGLAAMRGVPGAAAMSHTAGLSGGVLVADDATVWWVGAGVPHPVLTLEEGLLGILSADVDGDGTLDAAAWSADRLVTLRGRPGGGVARGPTVSMEGFEVRDVSAGDPSGDGLTDLAVAFAAVDAADTGAALGLEHQVVVLEGDGAWGFVGVPYSLDAAPLSLAIGDNAGEGVDIVTVLVDSGAWVRLAADTGGYARVTPGTVALLEEGFTVRSGFDINGDGAEELIALGPYVPGAAREIVLFDLSDSITTVRIQEAEARFAFGDANKDGRDDVFVVGGDGTLQVLSFTGADYIIGATGITGLSGPVAVTDLDGDDLLDVLVAGTGAAWPWFPGTQDDENRWRPADPGAISYAVALDGPLATVPGVGLSLAGVVLEDEGPRLVVWSVSGSMDRVTEVPLPYTSSTLDLAVCDGAAWVLSAEGLYRVDLGAQAVTASAAVTDPRSVACGEGPSGAVAGLLDGDQVVLLDAQGASVGSEDAGGATELALGGSSWASCASASCAVAWWGQAGGFVIGDGGALTLQTEGGSTALGGVGHPSIGDVDGDGHDDLVAVSGPATFQVFRHTGEGIGPMEPFHLLTELSGAVAIGDANGDGAAELVGADGQNLVLVGNP